MLTVFVKYSTSACACLALPVPGIIGLLVNLFWQFSIFQRWLAAGSPKALVDPQSEPGGVGPAEPGEEGVL